MKNAQMNWDDIRFVLAVADEGSVAGAARRLGVNHATVLRRIAAFETSEGMRLFDKTARGYRVSADRIAIVEAMRNAAIAVDDVAQMIDTARPRLSGSLRITSTDTMCDRVLPEIVHGLAEELDTDVDLIAANAHVDFSRLQADIAIRVGPSLPDDMIGEHAAEVAFAIYGLAGSQTAPYLGLSAPISRSPAGDWLKRQSDAPRARLRCDSFMTLAALAQQGGVRAILPRFIGDGFEDLVRHIQPKDMRTTSLWVACHRDVARSSRLIRARRFLAEQLSARRSLFSGQN